MQLRQLPKLDTITMFLVTGILLCVARLVETSLNMPTPPGIGITLSAIIVIFFLTQLALSQQWVPNLAATSLALMTFTSVGLLIIVAQTGNLSNLLAWTGVVLGLSATGLIGLGTFSKPLHVARDVESIQTAPIENTSLEAALVSKLNLLEVDAEEVDMETITQSWTRIRTLTGHERLEGSIRILFAENQKIYNLHLPIYPVFEVIPSVWCETEDTDLTTDIDTKQVYGVRIRIRRQGNIEEAIETELFVVMSTAADALADVA